MIDFYKKADEKRRGELDFVPDWIEEKFMLLLIPKKKKRASQKKISVEYVAPVVRRPRAFCDVYYEQA